MAELLTTAEAAAVLRCNRRTLQREVQRGHLRPIVVNSRRTLYRRDDLEAYIEERTIDQAAIVADALQLLAEQHAEDERPLCPECGRRRVTRGHDWCKWCEQQRDAELMDKRQWWDRNRSQHALAQRKEAADG